jgi:hypothetical protein
MEDIDKIDSTNIRHLKLWADKHQCHGDIKCMSPVPLQHRYFIVTSNNSLDDLLKGVPQVHADAILRRFTQIHFVLEMREGVQENEVMVE